MFSARARTRASTPSAVIFFFFFFGTDPRRRRRESAFRFRLRLEETEPNRILNLRRGLGRVLARQSLPKVADQLRAATALAGAHRATTPSVQHSTLRTRATEQAFYV